MLLTSLCHFRNPDTSYYVKICSAVLATQLPKELKYSFLHTYEYTQKT